MRQGLILIMFAFIASMSYAQSNNKPISITNPFTLSNMEIKQPKKPTSLRTIRQKASKISRKKSSDLISINAYKKSLQIKLKTVKPC